VEAHLISPWGTWEWMGPAAVGRELPARGTMELGFDVAPPVWVEPGQWWALIPPRSPCGSRTAVAASVGGVPVWVEQVDAREDRLRGSRLASSLPRRGT